MVVPLRVTQQLLVVDIPARFPANVGVVEHQGCARWPELPARNLSDELAQEQAYPVVPLKVLIQVFAVTELQRGIGNEIGGRDSIAR